MQKATQLKQVTKPSANMAKAAFQAVNVSPQKNKQAIIASFKNTKLSQPSSVPGKATVRVSQATNISTQKVAQSTQNGKTIQTANVVNKKIDTQNDITTAQSNKLEKSEAVQQGNVEKAPAQNVKTPPKDKGSPQSRENKEDVGKAKADKSPVEKRELDPLLTQVLDEELQDIMIQVWQELPDNPEDEDEKVTVDKLRNEVGDDLRRVLGLNVTKRLLNVFNNLFVKIYFTCRPQMGCLTTFLSTYNIKKFKRIDKDSNVFAAHLMSIEDFDKLCLNKELTCGEAKVTVTPCYKFTQCPENLKTIYDDTFYYDDNTAQEHAEFTKYDEGESIGEKSGDTQFKKWVNEIDTIEETDLDMEIEENDLEDYMDVEENDLEGDEELDDEDILALMSEGVVVDECSGSDDEK